LIEDSKIKEFLNKLAGAVIGAIREGSSEDRARLIEVLNGMTSELPDSSAEAAQIEDFNNALVSLLEGSPVSPEGLVEPYAGIYARIVEKALSTGKENTSGDDEMKEFLTQLSATVVMVMKENKPEDKTALAEKLREMQRGLPPDKMDAGQFILSLVSILEGAPMLPEALPSPYVAVYRSLLSLIASSSH